MVYMKKSPFLQKYLDLKSGLGYTIKISQGGFNVNVHVLADEPR